MTYCMRLRIRTIVLSRHDGAHWILPIPADSQRERNLRLDLRNCLIARTLARGCAIRLPGSTQRIAVRLHGARFPGLRKLNRRWLSRFGSGRLPADSQRRAFSVSCHCPSWTRRKFQASRPSCRTETTRATAAYPASGRPLSVEIEACPNLPAINSGHMAENVRMRSEALMEWSSPEESLFNSLCAELKKFCRDTASKVPFGWFSVREHPVASRNQQRDNLVLLGPERLLT